MGRKFRIMDDDGSNTISDKEFQKAMPVLGLGALPPRPPPAAPAPARRAGRVPHPRTRRAEFPKQEIDNLFDAWDTTGAPPAFESPRLSR